MGFQKNFSFLIKPTAWMPYFSIGVLTLVGMSLLSTEAFSMLEKIGIFLSVLVLSYFSPRPLTVCTVECTETGECWIEQASGDILIGTPQPESFIHPVLCIVHLAIPKQRHPQCFILWPHQIEAEAFRHFRVWLKWHVQGGLK